MLYDAMMACLPWAGVLLAAIVALRLLIAFAADGRRRHFAASPLVRRVDFSPPQPAWVAITALAARPSGGDPEALATQRFRLKAVLQTNSIGAIPLWRRVGRRLCLLHRDQAGSAQSLSFVLTVPLFVMLVMLIVQVSQIMIAQIVVHYAAHMTARSACVWIPAYVSVLEQENCISALSLLDMSENGSRYEIAPGSPKFSKIESAAIRACAALAPSRSVGAGAAPASTGIDVIESIFAAIAPSSTSNARVPVRLRNKLAYSSQNTIIELSFRHKTDEPELATYLIPDDPNEFYINEVGWQDPITAKVRHKLALLPGPGRLLAQRAVSTDVPVDRLAERIESAGSVYKYEISASATAGNDGEKSVLRYVQRLAE